MIGRKIVLVHAEAVAAFGIHVEFCGLLRFGPLLIESDAVGCEAEIVVGGSRDEPWRSVGGNGCVFEPAGGCLDCADEGGPALGRVMEGDSGRDRSAGGEADHADAVWGN